MGPAILAMAYLSVSVALPAVSKDGSRVALSVQEDASCGGDPDSHGQATYARVLPVPTPAHEYGASYLIASPCPNQTEMVERQIEALNRELADGGFKSLPATTDLTADAKVMGDAVEVTIRRGKIVIGSGRGGFAHRAVLHAGQVVRVSSKAYFVHVSWLFRGVPHRPSVYEWIPVMLK